jgi:uncharacterized membrane protein
MAVGGIVLAAVMVEVDRKGLFRDFFEQFGLSYIGDVSSSATVLSTLAGAMITVAGTTFSIAIVVFTLASTQYGPRLLRNFMRDTGNQFALGTYIATFVYCLVVLRRLQSTGEQQFIPHTSVSLAVLLAIASLGVLIFFIHHATKSIQGVNIINTVSKDLAYSIDRLYPLKMGGERPASQDGSAEEDVPANFRQEAQIVQAAIGGYLQWLDEINLIQLASAHDLIIKLRQRPGAFIIEGMKIAEVWPAEKLDDKVRASVNAAFIVGKQRTQAQDVEYDINQLVEMAIRALSPAINDPFTAMMCVDRLGQGLSQLFKRNLPSPYRYDGQGRLRIIASVPDMEHLIKAAFNQIRQYGRSSVSVTVRMLEVITVLAEFATTEEERDILLEQAQMLDRGCEQAIPEENDRQTIHDRYQKVLKALGQAPAQKGL